MDKKKMAYKANDSDEDEAGDNDEDEDENKKIFSL